MDRWAVLLDDLGRLINLPLHLDSNRACQLLIDHQLHLHIQEGDARDTLLISTFIAEVPPGPFREKIFKEALKENHLFPRAATLCYSHRKHQLALYASISLIGLDGDALSSFLEKFLERAILWKKGIDTGHLPQVTPVASIQQPSIFDLKT